MKASLCILLVMTLCATTLQAAERAAASGPVLAFSQAGKLLHATASTGFGEQLRSWIGKNAEKDAYCPPGLIVYLTDHMQAENNGRGWRYRKDLLLDYQNYGTPEKEVPLKDCTHEEDAVSKAVCEGKGVMLFHMLRGLFGETIFFDAVKSLIAGNECPRISWGDIRTAFEKASGDDLDWFFSQWVDRKGAPEFDTVDERVTVIDGVQTVSFDIPQKGEIYRCDLPVTVKTQKGEFGHTVHIEKEREHVVLPVEGDPIEIRIDSDYAIMRKLSPDESPPLLSGLLGDDKKLLVSPGEAGEDFRGFLAELKEMGFTVREEGEITDEDIRSHSLFIAGSDNRVVKRLFGSLSMPASGFVLSVMKNPLNRSKVIAIAHWDGKEPIPPSEEVFRHARQSYLKFVNEAIMEKATDNSARGIILNIYEPVVSIQPSNLRKLEDDLDTILQKTIIYAGERHLNYEDHRTQLKIIMSLYERGHTFAIGMEMFQKPFQHVIDDYLSGTLSEREFLKRTEYFRRWQFDYNLYREIIDYAKAKKIPVIALNLWTEIIKKVSQEGLDSLTDIERTELPASMDMSDEAYRDRLEAVFKQHRSHETKSFDNFYQSQILWDETMAHSVDDFLRKNPRYQMIVLAGAGHLMYGSGIPKRAYRLNKKDYVVILPGGEFMDAGIADYLVAAGSFEPPTTLKLGVMLKENDGYVQVEKVVPGSIAKSAGLKEGDILVSLDDWKIEDIADVNIFMSDKKRGEQVMITVLRKKFLAGYREVELEGTL